MNTPAHAMINLVLLARKEPPKAQAVVVTGALIPDVPMFVFYFIEKVINGRTEALIWSQLYHAAFWQQWIDAFNSFPLIGAGLCLSWYKKWRLAALFFLSMLLHVLADFFLHHDDAHRHFFPFWDFRYLSPVSYWDPRYHGAVVFPLEVISVLAAAIILVRMSGHVMSRRLVYLIGTSYVFYIAYVFVVWV